MAKPRNIIVGMSGGVDSSVSALLLKDQGETVSGLFMKNWEEDDRFGTCPAERDADDARAVADQIGIDLHTRNFAAEYWDGVFEHFLAEYRAGRTPNPDILCNREIKFKTFLEHARDLGASHIATGHYARVGEREGEYQLLRGHDHKKDQSYFLYTLGQEQLACTLFPVGEIDKPRVRELATRADLPVADKKDSTGICFIGERNFRAFLEDYLPANPGEMITDEGQVIGEHGGLMYYTIGQRKGLNIGGVAGASEAPWYVLAKDMDNNRLVVGQGHDHPWLFADRLQAADCSWVSPEPPTAGSRVTAKIRYRQADQACTIEKISNRRLMLKFDTPQRAITPGQSVVLYDGEVCLGGAVIERASTPIRQIHADSGNLPDTSPADASTLTPSTSENA